MPEIVSELVEIIVFRFKGNRPEILLLKRSREETPYPGIWQVVTGRIQPGEKSLEAARREVVEETGLDGLTYWVLPFVGSFYDALQDRLELIPFFAAEAREEREVRLSPEHETYRWVELPVAPSMLPWPAQKEALRVFRETILSGGQTATLTLLH